MTGTGTEGFSDAYLNEARQLAGEVETLADPGDKNWDLAQYTIAIIHELNRARCRIAFLEGWKEGVEPFIAKQRPRPPVYRGGVVECGDVAESTTPGYPGPSRLEGRDHV